MDHGNKSAETSSEDGSYYFVNHDDYSRWAAIDKLRTISFVQVKEVLDRLFAILKTPIKYKSDNGSPFQSYQFAEYAKQMGFIHQRITPRWPRANGEDQELQCFLETYRETPHTTTGVAPAKLLFLHARTSGIPEIEELNFEKIKNLYEFARANDRKAKEKMKQEYDKRMKSNRSRSESLG
ncbi:unnamed protein product [Brachionus calyciflorus]|uniref:Integrase catalytic domain-containing protein n=1 Tax=Brachionus calyciflorus TaxID=104777 RepID=A0A813WYW8_9BILA|nr:unnamed protein product [Brachionus calyciflorus]